MTRITGTWKDYTNELKRTVDMCKKYKLDWLTIVMGDEGGGKTTFSIKSALEVDPKFNLKNQMVYNLEEFAKTTLKFMGEKKEDVQKLRSIIWDEAVDSLFSRNYSSPIQKDLIRLYIKNRSLQHFTFINIPSPFYVDLYLRAHRAKCMAYCWMDRENFNKRYVSLYYRDAFRHFLKDRVNSEYLMLDREAFLKAYPPSYTFAFTGLEGSKLWNEYEDMKYNNQKETIKKIGDNAQLRRKAEETQVNRHMPMKNFIAWLSYNFTARDKMGEKRDDYLTFSYELLAKEGYTAKSNVTYLVNKAINEGLIYKIGVREYQLLKGGIAMINKGEN